MKKTAGLSHAHIQMILNKVPFFREFNQDEKERVAGQQSSFLVAKPKEKIVTLGSMDRAFFLLLSGNANVMKGDTNQVLVVLEPGEVFGEVTFLTETPRTSDVIADGVCILLRIDQALMTHYRAEIREKIKDQLIAKLVQRVLKN